MSQDGFKELLRVQRQLAMDLDLFGFYARTLDWKRIDPSALRFARETGQWILYTPDGPVTFDSRTSLQPSSTVAHSQTTEHTQSRPRWLTATYLSCALRTQLDSTTP